MSYTFSGATATNNSGGNSVSVTLNIGATTNPFVIVAIHEQNAKTAGGSVTVGGVSIGSDIVDASGNVGIFSGIATGQSGSVTITFTATASIAFETVGFSVWYTTDPVSKLHVGSVSPGTTIIVPVNSGDFLFAIGEGGTAFDFNSSTATPSASRSITGDGNNGFSADWAIASSASFSVIANHSVNAAAASYGIGVPVGIPFGVIGLSSCDW